MTRPAKAVIRRKLNKPVVVEEIAVDPPGRGHGATVAEAVRGRKCPKSQKGHGVWGFAPCGRPYGWSRPWRGGGQLR